MGYAKSMSSHSAKAVNTPSKVGGNRPHRHPAGRPDGFGRRSGISAGEIVGMGRRFEACEVALQPCVGRVSFATQVLASCFVECLT